MKYILVFILCVCFFEQNRADLPVHCLAKNIQGSWTFYMSNTTSKFDLCGHNSPNQNTDNLASKVKEGFDQNQNISINLVLPNMVFDHAGKRIGNWTMVYDEGFEIRTNDFVFFAFSKYTFDYSKVNEINNEIENYLKKDKSTFYFQQTPKNDDDEQTRGYSSICNETYKGWFHDRPQDNLNFKWGCFYGEQGNGKKTIQAKALPTVEQSIKIVQRDDLKKPKMSVQQQIDDEINKMDSSNYRFIQNDSSSIQNYIQNTIKDMNDMDDGGLYERFKENKTLYDYPHMDYLTNTLNDINQDSQYFETDFEFIELINSEKSKSPWKAKAHDMFKNTTHQTMKNMLGLNQFNSMKLQSFLQNNLSMTSRQSKKHSSFLEMQNKIKNKMSHKFRNGLNFKLTDQEKVQLNNQNSIQGELDKKHGSKNKNKNKNVYFEENTMHLDICGLSDSEIPRCFDWRNANDKFNYDGPIKKQGECGSCYAVAILSAIEARIKIQSNKKYSPHLSVSSSISCSSYNQGCNGGYPFLTAKHGYDFGFISTSCQPDTESDRYCNYDCFNDQENVWRIDNYGYVGGYYGATNEQLMMHEIYHKGPVVVAINASPDLYYYSSGVFITNPTNSMSESNDNQNISSWQYTNHAVTCVGWGETEHQGEKIKYWILKNSWGEDWGENGYFKMLRGVNLAAIENQAVFLNPSFKGKK